MRRSLTLLKRLLRHDCTNSLPYLCCNSSHTTCNSGHSAPSRGAAHTRLHTHSYKPVSSSLFTRTHTQLNHKPKTIPTIKNQIKLTLTSLTRPGQSEPAADHSTSPRFPSPQPCSLWMSSLKTQSKMKTNNNKTFKLKFPFLEIQHRNQKKFQFESEF